MEKFGLRSSFGMLQNLSVVWPRMPQQKQKFGSFSYFTLNVISSLLPARVNPTSFFVGMSTLFNYQLVPNFAVFLSN